MPVKGVQDKGLKFIKKKSTNYPQEYYAVVQDGYQYGKVFKMTDINLSVLWGTDKSDMVFPTRKQAADYLLK